MNNTSFKSCYFNIASKMLSEPEAEWSSWVFKGYKRADVLEFFKYLVKEKVLERRFARGPKSCSVLKDPEKLLDICINRFRDSERKIMQFISRRSHEEILNDLKAKNIEFYLGRFSGIRAELREVYDNSLSIIIPERKYIEGYELQVLQYKLGMSKVLMGGDIIAIFPKYKKFLMSTGQIENGMRIPSDFYSILTMATTKSPMGKPQLEHMIEKLQGKKGSVLSWKTK